MSGVTVRNTSDFIQFWQPMKVSIVVDVPDRLFVCTVGELAVLIGNLMKVAT